MQAMTDDEVRAFVKKNEWATGLKVDGEGRGLYYDNAESNCIELKFPEKPMQVPYFARMASCLNLEREELVFRSSAMVDSLGYRQSSTRKNRLEDSRENATCIWRDSTSRRGAGPFLSER